MNAEAAVKAKAPSASAAPAVEAPPLHIIAPGTTTPLEFKQNAFWAIASKGSKPEDYVMKPGPFALISHDLTRFDTIRLIDPDETWLVELIVVDCGMGYAFCKAMFQTDIPHRSELDAQGHPDYEIVPAGITDQELGFGAYVVRRKSDLAPLNNGALWSYTEAALFLANHAAVRGTPSSHVRKNG